MEPAVIIPISLRTAVHCGRCHRLHTDVSPAIVYLDELGHPGRPLCRECASYASLQVARRPDGSAVNFEAGRALLEALGRPTDDDAAPRGTPQETVAAAEVADAAFVVRNRRDQAQLRWAYGATAVRRILEAWPAEPGGPPPEDLEVLYPDTGLAVDPKEIQRRLRREHRIFELRRELGEVASSTGNP